MKPFNLANYDRLNLECVVAGKTYTDEDFELGSLSSSDSSSASITVKGRLEDFELFRNTSTIMINIITAAETIPFIELFVKHPVSFNGEEITADLDTSPRSKNISYTSLDGHALPYAFGKPHVKAPLVTERVVGVVTESQYALSYNNVNSIFEAYLAALPALGQVSLFGLDTDQVEGLQGVQDFYKVIRDLQQLVPDKAAILNDFYPMVSWRGNVSTYKGTDYADRFVYYKNKGLPPPISMYSMLQINNNSDVDYNTSVGYGANVSASDKNYYNVQTGVTYSLESIYNYYVGLCNQLLAIPNTIKIDIGEEYTNPVTLKIQGLQVTGNYLDGVLTVSNRAPEAVNWGFSQSGYDKINVPSLAGRDVSGQFVKIRVSSAVYSGISYTFTGAVKVLEQAGNVLQLDMVPFENFASNTNISPAAQTYSHGSTLFSGMILQGTILAVSDTLEGANYEGQASLVRGNYTWRDATLVEVPAYYIEAVGSPEDVNTLVYYKDYSTGVGTTQGAFIQTGSSYGADPSLANKAAYAYAFEESDFAWKVLAGDTVELDVGYNDIYVADMRPNMTVLGMKAKVGELYVDVPSDYYTVIPEHPVDDILTTGVKITADLEEKDLSNDIVIWVDSTQYSVDEILTPLAVVLDKSYNNIVPFPATILPNFAVYGFTDVLDVFSQVTEQAKGAYTLSVDDIKTKYLASVQPVDLVFDLDNMESFDLSTTDALDLINNTKFTWNSLSFVDKEAIIRLTDQPETLEPNTTKDVTIFEDGVQARDFGRWWVHRMGRDWLRVEIVGFPTDMHVEALDVITLQVEGYDIKGEVEDVTYDHESGAVTLNVILGDDLWTIGADIE